MLLDVFKDWPIPTKPILICGKGPSLDELGYDFLDYYSIGINDVYRYVPVDMSFFIHNTMPQFTVPRDKPVIMPYHPHNAKIVGPLSDYEDAYHYNLNTAPMFYNSTPIVTQDGLTIHALLNVLGYLGVKQVTTVGIDGGTQYAKIIPYGPSKRSHNITMDYSLQFPEIKRITERFDMTLDKYDKYSAVKPDTVGSARVSLSTSRLMEK